MPRNNKKQCKHKKFRIFLQFFCSTKKKREREKKTIRNETKTQKKLMTFRVYVASHSVYLLMYRKFLKTNTATEMKRHTLLQLYYLEQKMFTLHIIFIYLFVMVCTLFVCIYGIKSESSMHMCLSVCVEMCIQSRKCQR